MRVIPYTIQRSVSKIIRGRKCWYYEYEHILVNVNDATAAFLEADDKREQRYQWRIKKQMQAAKIYTVFSLDEIIRSEDGEDFPVSEIIEDTVHSENRDPLDIIIEREEEEEREKNAAAHNEMYAALLTKKQYEVWKYFEDGYSLVEIGELLGIDESSARERLHNAFKRIQNM